MKEQHIFETSNVDLATFLMYEGIKLLEFQTKESKHNIIVLRFLDDKQNCVDLERVFLNSDFKKFRDINKWILKKIHEKIKETKDINNAN